MKSTMCIIVKFAEGGDLYLKESTHCGETVFEECAECHLATVYSDTNKAISAILRSKYANQLNVIGIAPIDLSSCQYPRYCMHELAVSVGLYYSPADNKAYSSLKDIMSAYAMKEIDIRTQSHNTRYAIRVIDLYNGSTRYRYYRSDKAELLSDPRLSDATAWIANSYVFAKTKYNELHLKYPYYVFDLVAFTTRFGIIDDNSVHSVININGGVELPLKETAHIHTVYYVRCGNLFYIGDDKSFKDTMSYRSNMTKYAHMSIEELEESTSVSLDIRDAKVFYDERLAKDCRDMLNKYNPMVFAVMPYEQITYYTQI